ncbi:beta-N-acetylhexosaminidase [Timonella sp. A28]|uniref:beta-N-acetylhexosaminidase n=1 Tax=Timonella sp. A28 TaxID=3442640 RepID=UPI003EBEB11A
MTSFPRSAAPLQFSEAAQPQVTGLGLLPLPSSGAPVVQDGVDGEATTFCLLSGSFILADTCAVPAARLFARYLHDGVGVSVAVLDAENPAAEVLPCTVRFVCTDGLTSGYELSITPSELLVRARDEAGFFAAVATLRQLLGVHGFRAAASPQDFVVIPAVRVTDSPRFGWRGIMLDVARHFMPKAAVLRFIDLAAAHKLNIVHLHLSDDQGWRVEIKKYPELTRVGSWRTESNRGAWRHKQFDGEPHGGFYTQDDIREIVAFARARGVTVLPEIDVPGHSEAAIAAYPELGCALPDGGVPTVRTSWGISTNVLKPLPATVEFFKNVFAEIMDIFDTPYIGLGGDEVPPLLWREDDEVVAFAGDVGLDSVDELHGWFLGQLADFVVSHGRRPVVWDEGVSPYLPKSAIVTTWRGYQSGAEAMALGYDIVLAPEQNLYFDHRAAEGDQEPIPVGFVRTLEDVLAFEPDNLPHFELDASSDSMQRGSLLGVQAQVWTEQLNTPRRVDYATFPRLCAFAEVAWSKQVNRASGAPASVEFIERLVEHHLPRLSAAGVEYRPLSGPLPWQQRPGVPGWPLDLAETLKAAGSEGHVGGWREGMEL